MSALNIGTCVNYFSPDLLDGQFATLKQYNFDSCQLVSWNVDLWTDENAALINELKAKYGVTISAFWCGWEGPKVWDFYEGQLTLGLVPEDFRAIRVKNLCDGADFAKKIGVKDVVTHMGYIPENPYDPNFARFCVAVKQVAQHLKKNEQNLLFETGQETPVAMLRTFEQVNMDNLFVNLDTANVILYGKANPVDALEVFGKYVKNLHAKDGNWPTNGHEIGNETKIGDGKVDFVGVFKKLHELGYDGYVTIEREIHGDQQIKDILESREYLNGIIDEIWG